MSCWRHSASISVISINLCVLIVVIVSLLTYLVISDEVLYFGSCSN
jgi:hypothetical protein